MKRFHVHAHVDDLKASVAFYSKLFAAEPTRLESDYAKWMIEDPRINFAISTRGGKPGVDHLGFQTDSDEELVELKERAQAADMAVLDEGETTCCYARSEKHWVTDPQGIAWEHFHTLDSIPTFSQTSARSAERDRRLLRQRRPRAAGRSPFRSSRFRPAAEGSFMANKTYNVLFVCTGNSARSIIAEGLMNDAGPRPLQGVLGRQPPDGRRQSVRAARRSPSCACRRTAFAARAGTSSAGPDAPPLDFVFTVCDRAAGETCPFWPGQPMTAHWGVAGPRGRRGKRRREAQAVPRYRRDAEAPHRSHARAADRKPRFDGAPAGGQGHRAALSRSVRPKAHQTMNTATTRRARRLRRR